MSKKLKKLKKLKEFVGTYVIHTYHNAVGTYKMRNSRCIDVRVFTRDNGDVGIGYAVCSIFDLYDEYRAKQIATGRALKDLDKPYEYEPWNDLVQMIRNTPESIGQGDLIREFCGCVVRTIDKRIDDIRMAKAEKSKRIQKQSKFAWVTLSVMK